MRRLGDSAVWSFLDGTSGIERATNPTIRMGRGRRVSNYLELAARVAELQFRNPSHVLLFRGQTADHKSSTGHTSLKSSIFRPPPGKTGVGRVDVADRYRRLSMAEDMLALTFRELKRLGAVRVQRQRLLRWSILQHYEVCATPLLDVTQSLRIAASFASLGDDQEGFVYALAVPNVSGAITVSLETGLQIVRLAGVCPPSALRPHLQEGFLLGEYPDLGAADQIENYKPSQFDFGLRMIAKFQLTPATFWVDDNFPQVTATGLYPSSKDWLENRTKEIREHLSAGPSK